MRRTRRHIVKWSALALLLVLFGWFQFAYWTSTNDCNNPVRGEGMKAIKLCEHGIDGLRLTQAPKPLAAEDQVLIKVHAASLNSLDVYMTRGAWIGRLFFGLRKPRDPRLGRDVAGHVEAVGSNVTEFKPGDEVFGICNGALAEYAVARERTLVRKPRNVSFEEAAAVPLAALTALQGLRQGNVQAHQKVLVNGATGGVGTFAVQIAKALGAEVTAVCSTRNVDLVRSIGADRVIDYTKENFTQGDQRYDAIFDNVGNHSASDRRRVLTPKGTCVLVGVGGASARGGELLRRIAATFIASGMSSSADQKFAQYVTKVTKDDLLLLSDLLQSGKIRPVIEQTYNLAETPQALRRFDQGHTRGKLVISLQ